MKFRAIISDSAAMRDFMNIALSLSKFSKECVMRITERNVYFIVSQDDSGLRRPLVWCDLPANFYFKDYNVVGVNDEFNEIFLELSTAQLARSISVLKQNAKSMKMKLTNKDFPCLTLEMDLVHEKDETRQCVYDIRVDVISRKYWSNYEEPRFDDFHISLTLPQLKHLKNTVEKMKNISNQLIVSANKLGRLILRIKTPIVQMAIHFPNMNIESFAVQEAEDSENQVEESEDVSSTIDVKQFLLFLNGMLLHNGRAMCSIVHKKMVKLHMEQIGAFKLQIFLSELSD